MLAGSNFRRALHRAAPVLSRRFFSCSQKPIARLTAEHIHAQPSQVSKTRTFRHAFEQKRKISSAPARKLDATFPPEVPYAVEEIARQRAQKSSRFPDTSSNAVAYWLLGSAASVFGIVVFGGWTRLTESGLSITEWKPVTGSLPPMSDADWASEFLKYQASPEFHLLNSRMTLEEFKSIYWMEWIHRLWGRAIGLTFIIPAAYFVLRKQVSRPMGLRLAGIAGLIGFQGFIGWWMVKSGLKDDLFAPGSHPRVSQYRLTAHLGTAFLCYTAMLWNGLSILRTNRLLSLTPSATGNLLIAAQSPALRRFKICVAALTALVFTTAMSGGLVAGLDAGLIYNEFPYMGLGLTPPKSELFDPFYSRDPERKDMWWRNALENPSLVQLDHRVLATTTFAAVHALWAYARFSKALQMHLPRAAQRAIHGVVGFVWLQVVLGISTLIYLVPLPLASAHQAGSLALLTWTFVLGSRVWFPRGAARIFAQRMALKPKLASQSGMKMGGGGSAGGMDGTGASVQQNRAFSTIRPKKSPYVR